MKLFSAPKIPAAPQPKALPREDDEAARQAKIREFAKLQKSSGRESTRLGQPPETRLGDYNGAITRGSAVLAG